MPCGIGQNKTPPVPDSVLRPMLAATRYLIDTLGPHAIDLIMQVRDADRKWSHTRGEHVLTAKLPAEQLTRLLVDYEHRGEPLPLAAEHTIRDRLATGWAPEDPLTRLSLGLLARQAGFTQFWRQWIPPMRDRLEATLAVVGAEKPFGRNAVSVDRADGGGTLAWTLPLDRLQAVALVGIVRTAAIALLASGVRDALQRADGAANRLLPPTRAARTRAGSLPPGQQGHQRTTAGRGHRRMGGHRARLPGRPAARTAAREP